MSIFINSRVLKSALAITVLIALATLSFYVVASNSEFDYEKYKVLSIEKRNAYDVIFFNELETWNLNSTRYSDSDVYGRRNEFKRMADDGYLPAYAALRLIQVIPATLRYDTEAFDMLLKAAEQGDASAMCAVDRMPLISELHQYRYDNINKIFYAKKSAELGNGACMALYGRELLLGNAERTKQSREKALPYLFESARLGYYVSFKAFFQKPLIAVLQHQFDFSNEHNVKRAMCWGRLSEQHTSWSFFDSFLSELKDYALKNNRIDLLEMSKAYDPRFVPGTVKVVNPEDCIKLENLME